MVLGGDAEVEIGMLFQGLSNDHLEEQVEDMDFPSSRTGCDILCMHHAVGDVKHRAADGGLPFFCHPQPDLLREALV